MSLEESSDGTKQRRDRRILRVVAVVRTVIRAAVAVALAAAGVAMLLLRMDPSIPAAAESAAPPRSAVLSPGQIAQYAREAGFRGDGLTVAVAVALAESGGRPRAHNGVAPDDSFGLWQINMRGPLGPDRRQRYGLTSNRDLFDPAVNARVAQAISDGGRNWTPWTTYTRGSYRRFLDQAREGVRQAGEQR